MKISVATPNAGITYEESIIGPSSKADTTSTNASSSAFAKALSTSTVADKTSTVTSYKDIFLEASEKYGVSYDLLTAMAKQESGFNPNAVSKSGAMGIMQIMPATANELGLDAPFDAYDNIMAGADYISQKLAEYDGDVDLALAAYNAGSGTVNMYGGVPPYGETQSYVSNIKAMMESGVDVPYTNYIDKNASKDEIEADLKLLLSELPDDEEYSALKNTLAEMNYL